MKLLRVLPVALVAMALTLVVASSASAAITATQVNTPTGPVFGIEDAGAPPLEYTITGTATGSTAGEEIDLRCYYTSTESDMLSGAISVEADGSFTATGVEPRIGTGCVVRAVPTGTIPTGSELAAFSGPVFVIGESNVSTTGSTPYDFYNNAQQLTAAFDYDSINGCGIDDGYLNTNEFESITTYYCNDWFRGEDGSTTSGFVVGGESAYFSAAAEEIDSSATGIPPLTYSYTQNPLNGDMTIHDSESAAFCPTSQYPPEASNCEEFHPSGVRDDRTIEQSHDGHVSVITDQFSSTDGQTHTVEALPQNDQYFSENGKTLEYKFPGQSGYSIPTMGQSVGFADSTPGAVYLKVAGAADGDTETGRGAIVFFQPSSPANFNYVGYESTFEFDNHLTVPATGTTTVKYAYVQALSQAEVESLATELLTPPAKPVTTPAPVPISAPAPAVTVKFGKVVLAKKKGTAKLQVKVSGPGTLKLTGKKVKSKTVKAKKAGAVNVAIVPTAATMKALRKHGSAKVVVKVAFKGSGGGSAAKSRSVRLVLKG